MNQEVSRHLLGLFHFFSHLETSFDALPYCNYLFAIVHALSISVYIMMDALLPKGTPANASLTGTLLEIFLPSNSSSINTIILAIGSFVFFAMGAIIGMHIHLFSKSTSIYKESDAMRALSLTALFMLVIVEIIFFVLINAVVLGYLGLNSIQPTFALLIFCTLLVLFQAGFRSKHRLFHFIGFIISGLINLAPPNYGIVGVGAFSLLLYSEEKKNTFNKSAYFSIFIVAVWSALEVQSGQLVYATLYDPLLINPLCYLAMALLCTNAIFFLTVPKYHNVSPLDQNRTLLALHLEKKSLQNLEGQFNSSANMEAEYYYQKYQCELQQSHAPSPVSAKLREVPIHQWESDDVHALLWSKIKHDGEHDKSQEMKLFCYQAAVELNERLMETFKDISEYIQIGKTKGNLAMYAMYRTEERMYSKYMESKKSNDNLPELNLLIEAEKTYEDFYFQANTILFKVVQFWKEVLLNRRVISQDIETQLLEVVEGQRSLQALMNKLSAFNVDLQKRILNMIRDLVNPFEKSGQYGEKKKNNVSEQEISFEYLISMKGIMKKMSLKMFKSLKYSTKEVINGPLKDLFPDGFMGLLEQIERENFEQKKQDLTSIKLPLIDKEGNMHLCKCTLYLVPSFESFSFLYYFQREETSSKILFLYDYKSEKIQAMSETFKQYLGLGNTIEASQEFLRTTHLSEIFDTQITEKSIQIMRSNEPLSARIIFPAFLNKNSARNSNEVLLTIEYEVEFDQRKVLLIRVQSQAYKMMQLETIRVKEPQRRTTQLDCLARNEQYGGELFYCPIKNPYKPKIIQKLSSKRQITFKNYFSWLSLIVVVSALLVFASTITYYYYTNLQVSTTATVLVTMRDLNDEYTKILNMYYHCYLREYLSTHNASLSSYINTTILNGTGTAAIVGNYLNMTISYHISEISSIMDSFMSTYLSLKDLANHVQSNYLIYYSEFYILVNTVQSNFYDFLVSIQYNIVLNTEMPFLLQNYGSVTSIMPIYQQYLAFNSNYVSNFYNVYKIIVVLLILQLCFSMMSCVLSYRLIAITYQITKMYEFIEKRDILEQIDNINKIKQIIGTPINDPTRTAQNIISGELGKEKIFLDTIKNMDANPNGDSDPPPPPSYTAVLFKSCNLILVTISIALIGLSMAYAQYATLTTVEKQFTAVLQLYQKLQTQEMEVETTFLEVFQPYFMQNILNKSYTPLNVTNLFKIGFPSDSLPSAYSGQYLFEGTLCGNISTSDLMDPLLKGLSCAKIYNGVLEREFGESLEYYQSRMGKIAEMGFANYTMGFDSQSFYNLPTIIYTKTMIQRYLAKMKNDFMTTLSSFNQQSQASFTLINGISTTLGFLLLMGSVIALYLYSNRLKVYFGLIYIIPDSALYRLKMTKYIRTNNILEKLDRLY